MKNKKIKMEKESDGFLKKIISKLEGANEEAEKAYAEMAK